MGVVRVDELHKLEGAIPPPARTRETPSSCGTEGTCYSFTEIHGHGLGGHGFQHMAGEYSGGVDVGSVEETFDLLMNEFGGEPFLATGSFRAARQRLRLKEAATYNDALDEVDTSESRTNPEVDTSYFTSESRTNPELDSEWSDLLEGSDTGAASIGADFKDECGSPDLSAEMLGELEESLAACSKNCDFDALTGQLENGEQLRAFKVEANQVPIHENTEDVLLGEDYLAATTLRELSPRMGMRARLGTQPRRLSTRRAIRAFQDQLFQDALEVDGGMDLSWLTENLEKYKVLAEAAHEAQRQEEVEREAARREAERAEMEHQFLQALQAREAALEALQYIRAVKGAAEQRSDSGGGVPAVP